MANVVTVEVAARIAGLVSGLARAQTSLAEFSRNAEKSLDLKGAGEVGKKLGIASIATAAAACSAVLLGLAAAVRTGIAAGGGYNDLANRISETRGKTALMATAFGFAGLAAEDLADAVNRLQKSADPAALAKLGLTLDDLKRQSPTDALTDVGNRLTAIKDPFTRAQIASDLFGKSYGKLLQIFGDNGALELAKKTLGSMPDQLDKAGGGMDDLGDRVDALGLKWTAFSVGLTSTLTGLGPMLDQLLKIDTAKMGEALASEIAGAFTGKTVAGAIAELSGRLIRVMASASASLANIVAAALTSAFADPIATLQANIEGLGALIDTAMNGNEADQAMLGATNLESQLEVMRADLEDLESRKPGSGKKAWLTGASLELSPERYAAKKADLEKNIAETTRNRNAALDIANKAKGSDRFDAAMKSIEERKADILAGGGPRVGLGEGLTAEERLGKALKDVQRAVETEFPKLGSAVKEAVEQAKTPIAEKMKEAVHATVAASGHGSPLSQRNPFQWLIDSQLKGERDSMLKWPKLGGVTTAEEIAKNSKSSKPLAVSDTANEFRPGVIASALARIGGGGGFAGVSGMLGLQTVANNHLAKIAAALSKPNRPDQKPLRPGSGFPAVYS